MKEEGSLDKVQSLTGLTIPGFRLGMANGITIVSNVPVNIRPGKRNLGFLWNRVRELVITSLFEEDLVWGRKAIEDTTYLINMTDKILLALKFELTQKESASKSQHC